MFLHVLHTCILKNFLTFPGLADEGEIPVDLLALFLGVLLLLGIPGRAVLRPHHGQDLGLLGHSHKSMGIIGGIIFTDCKSFMCKVQSSVLNGKGPKLSPSGPSCCSGW